MTTTIQCGNPLTRALKQARMACKAVIRKEGKNSAQGYAYVGHEHVLTSGAREALLSQGLVLEQTGTEFAGVLEIPKKDGVSLVWRWRGTFQLAHEESGFSQTYMIEATTQANDKAAYVASTALERTMLLRLCQMSGGSKEDPEHDIHDRYEETQHRAATVTEKLDAIAAGGERAERPLATATRGRTSGAASRGGDPVPVAKVIESVGAQTDVAETQFDQRTGEVLKEAAEAGFTVERIMTAPVRPKGDEPTLTFGKYKGRKVLDENIPAGYYRWFQQQTDYTRSPIREWIDYAVNQHAWEKGEETP